MMYFLCYSGVRPFQCLYCDYSSSQKTHLTRHMRTHSGKWSPLNSVQFVFVQVL